MRRLVARPCSSGRTARMTLDLIRPLRPDEHPRVLVIINDAARRYRGVIPDDRWREPYMSEAQFAEELAAGGAFWGL